MTAFCFLTWTCNMFNTMLTGVCLEKRPSVIQLNTFCLMNDAWLGSRGRVHWHFLPLAWVWTWHKAPETASLLELSSASVLSAEMNWLPGTENCLHLHTRALIHNKRRAHHLPRKRLCTTDHPACHILTIPRKDGSRFPFCSLGKWFPSVSTCFALFISSPWFRFDHESWPFFLQ